MELNEALGIIRNLSDGLDPDSKQPLPTGSVYQRPSIIRALCTAVEFLNRQEQRRQRKSNLPTNSGKLWTRSEDAEVCEEFSRAENVFSIAKHHKRTVGSIAARLVKLGKMSADDLPRFVGLEKASRIVDYETASKTIAAEGAAR